MKFVSVVKLGRLTNGFQSDHGRIRHALPESDWYGFGSKAKALCGTQPGSRSVGWASDDDITEITCPRCLKKIEKMPIEWPKSEPSPVFDIKGKYIGHGLIDDDRLLIGDDSEIDLHEIERILNLSDPCMPESYYQLIR